MGVYGVWAEGVKPAAMRSRQSGSDKCLATDLGEDFSIRFHSAAREEGRPGGGVGELSERPGAGGADERFGIVDAEGERWDRRRLGSIAEHDGGVTQQAATLRPPERRVAESRAEGRVVEREEYRQIDRIGARGWV